MFGDRETGKEEEEEKTYECLGCGKIVRAGSHPLKCADCGGIFHNRATPRE